MTTRRAGAWALLRGLVRCERRLVLVAVGGALTWTAAGIAIPVLVQLAVDRGIKRGDAGAIVRYGVLIFAAALVVAAAYGVWSYFGSVASRRMEAELRERLFAQLQRLHLGYHDRTATGQLMGRMNSDLQQIQAFTVGIPDTAACAALLVGAIVLLVATNATLGLLLMAVLAGLAVSVAYYRGRVSGAARRLQQELGALSDLVEDSVSGIRAIKGLGAESQQARRVRSAAGGVYDRAMHWARIRAAYMPIWELVPAIGAVLVLWYGGHAVLRGEMSVGQLVAFNGYLALLLYPVGHFGGLMFVYERALAAATRSAEVLATEPAIADRPHARALPHGRGEVRLEGVAFAYPGQRDMPVFEHLDLIIPAGSTIALVGRTGTGKSTLAQLIARLYDVEEGAVLLDGVDVRDLRVQELRRAVGIVFQETFLFGDTVFDNIAFGDPDATEEDVVWAARLAGAHDFVVDLPDGYETVLGERGFSLSGGQRQRLAIARTLLTDPRVLILDDATSAVDPTKEHEIRAGLRGVVRDRTTVVIAHRPATIALADRVVLLDGGRIVAQGTHAELLAASEAYRDAVSAGAA